MAEKVTKMLIKVDLQCCRCSRKIKKILCKFPQIRDPVYDEKQNTVTITVVCCSPEKILQKIRCNGGNIIQSIEILPDKKKEKEDKGKESENEDAKKSKETKKEKKKEPELVPAPVLVPCYPPLLVYPMGACCQQCYQGHDGGPCYHGYGRPWPMCHDGCGRPAYDCQGGCNRGYYLSRCDYYFSEENATRCTIM